MKSLKLNTELNGLQPVEFFLRKNIQLFETIVVRHGLMVVGPTGAGKSKNIKVLTDALTMLKDTGCGDQHFLYEKVRHFELNPKAVTMGQLYGEFDPNTREFIDGIVPNLYRTAASDTTPDRKWLLFDGPVDAIWIESMNTVLDDNKKLCLNSGEMLQMSAQMSMIFEVDDLSQASPATVSRCGMVFMEPESLGLDPLIRSWLQTLPELVDESCKATLWRLFDTFMRPTLQVMRRFCKELVPSVDSNLCQSCCRIINTFFTPLKVCDGEEPPSPAVIDAMRNGLESIFLFALVWSVGGTVNEVGRLKIDTFLRSEMECAGIAKPIPADGLVYDYAWVPEESTWTTWMETSAEYVHDAKMDFAELVIPTKDSVRNTFLLKSLLTNGYHALNVGSTGTGKTININKYLQKEMDPRRYVPLCLGFSAQTSANQTQDIIDGKLEKRKKGVYGPAAGFHFIIYVDDLNMPQRELYFAQPPVELLRQCISQNGWYDRKTLTFRRIIDWTFVAAMGPPGGGRNPISARIKRWLNIVGYVEMDRNSKELIFKTILGNFLSGSDNAKVPLLTANMVSSTIDIYENISRELRPTPAKAHYTFNLRDLAKVFQGVLMCDLKKTAGPVPLARLWVHEARRVFQDRLINMEDVGWFEDQLKAQMALTFEMEWSEVVPGERLFFGDYMVPGADPRYYEEVDDHGKLMGMIEEYLLDYNNDSKTPMNLVMFLDAVEHVSRISRILRQPQGNALCLGVGGSGRQSLTRLAAFMAEYEVFQIEVAKGYVAFEWCGLFRTSGTTSTWRER
jgi:dynein heavy chain